MRILYCNKYNFRYSGTESYLLDAMEGMRVCGHEVALFSMADPRGQATEYDQYMAAPKDFKTARRFFAKVRLAGGAIYSFGARAKLKGLIKVFRPDVAHVRNIYHHLSPSILWELKAQNVPVIYHVNDFKLLCPAYNFVSRSGEICERCAGGKFWNAASCGCHADGRPSASVLAFEAYFHRWLKTYETCVDRILAPSQFVKDKFVQHGWPGSRIDVLPHFQNLPATVTPHPGKKGHILYFGRLSVEKGVGDLISAMAQAPHMQLVIAGDGPQRRDLEALISSLALRNVTFAGHVSGSALERLIAESQFTVFPSRAYETFGKSILESFAQGRAVVASDLGSRRELVEHGKTGLLYRGGDAAHLAAAIGLLHDRPELSAAMGEAGWRLAHGKYSPVHHFLKLQGLYQQLVEQSQKSVSGGKPVRVAFIGGRGIVGKYSGIETYYEATGVRLSATGHQITAYCRSYFTPECCEHGGVRIVRLPTIRTKHLETLVHTILSTVHVCFSKCDVVHYHTLGPALFSFIPRLFGKKTIVTVQGLDWKRSKWSWVARQTLKAGEWAAASFPSKTVVVSRALQSHFRIKYLKETAYVPNGTELRSRKSDACLQQFGLEPNSYVLFLGRLSPEKNCDLLIRAFAGIETKMKLVFAGGSSHSDEYVFRLRQQQNERVVFLDWLAGDALEEVLTNAAIFVLPSDIEGMSLALLDAMAAGLCVLASDIPENCEVVADAGFTFKRGSVMDLQRMLTLLLPDESLRAFSGDKARARVQENYLWENVTTQIKTIYAEVMGRPSQNVLPVKAASGARAA